MTIKASGRTRRSFLQAGTASFVVASIAGLLSWPKPAAARRSIPLDALFTDPASARRVAGYLAGRRTAIPPGRHALDRGFLEHGTDPATAGQRLAAQIRADFAAGRIEIVDGWVLSRTEVCLLAALHAEQA